MIALTPDRVCLKRLKERCTTSGVTWADCVWDPVAERLAIITMDKAGNWGGRTWLTHEDGTPRQLNDMDVIECWRSGHGNGMLDDIRGIDEKNAARKKRWEIERRHRIRDAIRANYRYKTSKTFSGGKQIGGQRDSDGGDGWCQHKIALDSCEVCNWSRLPQRYYMNRPAGSEHNGYRVNDRRRSFE